MLARGLAILALMLALLGARVAHAAPRVLVISTGAGDPVTGHLLDELVALGMTVEVTPALEGDLATLGRTRGAGAVLRVAPSRRAVDLWVDPGEGAPAAPEQRLEQDAAEPGDPAAALALRAVELVRGRLLRVVRPEVSPRPEPARAGVVADPPPPAPVTPPPVAPPARGSGEPVTGPATAGRAPPGRVSLYVVPSVVAHPSSGLSASGAALLGARWMLSPRFGGDLLTLFTVVPAIVEAPEGKARISAFAIGVGGWANLLDPALPIAAGAGAGMALGLMSYDANAERTRPDLEGQVGAIAYALPYARAALEWRVIPHWSLRGDALVGIAAPRPVVQIGPGRTDGIFGRPLLSFGLGVGMSIR